MNPLLKENQILKKISDISSKKKNDGKCLYWIELRCLGKKTITLVLPNEYETYEHFGCTMEEIRDKAVGIMFDLSINHYISNVKLNNRTMRINFKECLGGRKPNFGHRTVKKIVKIVETASKFPLPKTERVM